jgi:hypothetical protein
VSISLQGKVPLSKALSRTNPSALDLVLALAPVAFVLGVMFGGRLNSDSSIGLSTLGKSPVRDFAKLISQALILLCVYDFISESSAQQEG